MIQLEADRCVKTSNVEVVHGTESEKAPAGCKERASGREQEFNMIERRETALYGRASVTYLLYSILAVAYCLLGLASSR